MSQTEFPTRPIVDAVARHGAAVGALISYAERATKSDLDEAVWGRLVAELIAARDGIDEILRTAYGAAEARYHRSESL